MTAPAPTGLLLPAPVPQPTDLCSGIVTEVTSRGLTVSRAAGLIQNVAHLDSYNPAAGDAVSLVRFAGSWLCLGRPVGPGTPEDLATPGSGLGTTLLGGIVMSGTNTTIASSTGALVAVPRYRCTYHHPTGHHVLIMLGFTWYCSVAADTMAVTVWDAITGTKVGELIFNQSSNNFFSRFESAGVLVPRTQGGRKVDLYLQVQRLGGTGTSRIDDNSATPGYMVALDLGDGSVIATV